VNERTQGLALTRKVMQEDSTARGGSILKSLRPAADFNSALILCPSFCVADDSIAVQKYAVSDRC
jgi:hypothetical protein